MGIHAHFPIMVKDLWSSDLNRRAVDLAAAGPGDLVLDIGAGMGAGAVVTAPRVAPGGRVIAVDPSRAMRACMRLRSLGRPRRRLDVRAGSAESLPVAASTVDVAYAVNAAHHFADLPKFTAEVARVLRPGGRVVLVEEDLSHPDHPYQHAARGPGHGPHAVDGDELARLLADAGLEAATSTYRTVGATHATVISAAQPS